MKMTFFVMTVALLTVGNDIWAQLKTATCIQDICRQTDKAESLKSFLERVEKPHPDLESFWQDYAARLDAVRLHRKKRMAQAIEKFQPMYLYNQLIASGYNQGFIQLLRDIPPWNLGKKYENGKFVVVPVPLWGSDKTVWIDVTKRMYRHFEDVSPLFRAHQESKELNLSPHQVLHIGDNVSVRDVVMKMLHHRLLQVPSDLQPGYEKRIQSYMPIWEKMAGQYGEEFWLTADDLDLEMSIDANLVSLSTEELVVVREMMVQRLIDRAKASLEKKPDLEKIYDKKEWDKKCRESYNEALYYALTPAEAQGLKTLKTEAVRRAKAAATELFGADLADFMATYFNIVKIDGPMTLKDYRTFIENGMRKEEEGEDITEDDFLEGYNMLRELQDGEDRFLTDNVCNNFIFSPIRDFESEGRIVLSTYSLKHYEIGLQIGLHEMGHALSYAMHLLASDKTGKYQEFRNCINENYVMSDRASTSPETIKFTGDKLWTEEDGADAFEGYAGRDLNVNSSCTLMNIKPERDYLALQARGDDTHSPGFYRVLNVAIHQGRDVNQCQPALKEEHPGITFKRCL